MFKVITRNSCYRNGLVEMLFEAGVQGAVAAVDSTGIDISNATFNGLRFTANVFHVLSSSSRYTVIANDTPGNEFIMISRNDGYLSQETNAKYAGFDDNSVFGFVAGRKGDTMACMCAAQGGAERIEKCFNVCEFTANESLPETILLTRLVGKYTEAGTKTGRDLFCDNIFVCQNGVNLYPRTIVAQDALRFCSCGGFIYIPYDDGMEI